MNKPKLKLEEAPAPEAHTRRSPHPAKPREFHLTDGRPILLVRHAVLFAVPAKEAPDTQTLVSIKGGRPVPLAIPYADFKAWWEAK